METIQGIHRLKQTMGHIFVDVGYLLVAVIHGLVDFGFVLHARGEQGHAHEEKDDLEKVFLHITTIG